MARKPRFFILLLAALLVLQLGYGVWSPSQLTQLHAAGSAGPQLIGKSPADNAEAVAANANLILTFDEAVTRGTGSASVSIRRVSDNSVVESFEIATSNRVSISSGAPNVVTIDPIRDMTAGTAYYVLIDAGAFRGPTNVNYGGIASATAWNFIVGATDNTAPGLTASTGTVHAGTPFTMTFNEPVFAASGTITIRNVSDSTDIQVINVVSPSVTGSGTSTISIMPPMALSPNNSYTVTVERGAFQDGAGNNYAGTSWRLDVSAPPIPIVGLSPADEEAGVATNRAVPLVLDLSTNVVKGAADRVVEIRRVVDNSIFQRIYVSSSAVGVSGSRVTITPSSSFAANTGYYVLIDAGAFLDASDTTVLFQGIADAATWNFTTMPTVDNVRPTLVERKPADNAVQPSLRFPLELTFSEPVYPGNGNIVIKNAQNDLPVETIPVTSAQVVGGGSTVIKVTPSVTLVNNGRYYVQISNTAFRDAAGNTYAGILDTDRTSWNFTATQDNTVPTVVSFSPASGTVSVPTNGSVTITFTEAIQLVTDNIVFRQVSGSTGDIPATAAVDPTDSRKLIVRPTATLAGATSYYMEIPAGSIQDYGGNSFGGILNEHTYRFSTIGTDLAAPLLSSSSMSGSTKIELRYNEELRNDAASIPATGSFYVTVNDVYRAVTSVAVSGQVVTLTLHSGIVSGQEVRVYYTQPIGMYAIQDLSGNKAPSLNGEVVTTSPDSTIPSPTSASVNGSVVTVLFNETLQQVHTNAYSQFRITVNGSSYSATSSASNGSSLVLTFGIAVTSGQQAVSVSYTPGSYPLRDMTGNLVSPFNGFSVRNGLDASSPVIQSAVASGNIITLTFNEPLDPNSRPGTSQFTVITGGSARQVTAVTVGGSQVILSLGTSVTAGQTVSVSYIGGTPALRDSAGNPAGAFANYPASNGTSGGTVPNSPGLTSAIGNGSVITLTFGQQLYTSVTPSASQFIVRVNGVQRSLSAVKVNTQSVELTLASPLAGGEAVFLTYIAGLQYASGGFVSSLVDQIVSNVTGLQGSGSVAPAPVMLDSSAAMVMIGRSTAGDAAGKYTILSDRMSSAYVAARATHGDEPRVLFDVPSTEQAAIVEVPVQQLENAMLLSPRGVFGVRYKDMTYEIPLATLDFAKIRELGVGGGTVNLVIEVDAGQDTQTAELVRVIRSRGIEMIGNPMHFHIHVSNGLTSKELTGYKGYLNRTVTVSGPMTENDTAVVWLDPETGMLSYVPTSIVRRSGETVVTFRRMGNSAYALVRGKFAFSDIGNSHWARSDMLILANKFIVEGRTSKTFVPDKPVTRGEFATYVARGLGLAGDRASASVFKDVTNTTAMAAYIGAAAKAGIVTGVTSDRFQPNSPITREQMAAMMVRAARYAGHEIILNRASLDYLRGFRDNGDISSWARTDAAKAIEAGIISGMSPTSFSPKSNATRAQAVVMLKRMLGYMDFI